MLKFSLPLRRSRFEFSELGIGQPDNRRLRNRGSLLHKIALDIPSIIAQAARRLSIRNWDCARRIGLTSVMWLVKTGTLPTTLLQ
jgi:hypothetical protein